MELEGIEPSSVERLPTVLRPFPSLRLYGCRTAGSIGLSAHRRVFPRCQRSFSPSAVFPCRPPLLLLPGCSGQAPRALTGRDVSLDPIAQAARAKSPLALLLVPRLRSLSNSGRTCGSRSQRRNRSAPSPGSVPDRGGPGAPRTPSVSTAELAKRRVPCAPAGSLCVERDIVPLSAHGTRQRTRYPGAHTVRVSAHGTQGHTVRRSAAPGRAGAFRWSGGLRLRLDELPSRRRAWPGPGACRTGAGLVPARARPWPGPP